MSSIAPFQEVPHNYAGVGIVGPRLRAVRDTQPGDFVEPVEEALLDFHSHAALVRNGFPGLLSKVFRPNHLLLPTDLERFDQAVYAASKAVHGVVSGDTMVIHGSRVYASNENFEEAATRVDGLAVTGAAKFALLVEPDGLEENVHASARRGTLLEQLTGLRIPSLALRHTTVPGREFTLAGMRTLSPKSRKLPVHAGGGPGPSISVSEPTPLKRPVAA